jgi:hypothetical protein
MACNAAANRILMLLGLLVAAPTTAIFVVPELPFSVRQARQSEANGLVLLWLDYFHSLDLITASYPIHDIHSFRDLPEDCVASVEMRLR